MEKSETRAEARSDECKVTVLVVAPRDCDCDYKDDPDCHECGVYKRFHPGRTLECCLFTPHDGTKHYNPSLLQSCGGAHFVINGWSPAIDGVEVVRCSHCGHDLTKIGHEKNCERSL